MSKQTQKTVDSESIAWFLNQVAKKNGFTKFPEGSEGDFCGIYPEGVMLVAQKELSTEFGRGCPPRKDALHIRINLTKHQKLPLLLVVSLVMEGRGYLPGDRLLVHFGKRRAYYDDKGHDDFNSNDLSECWTVADGKGVEALLRAYDTLAINTGYKPIFNLV